MAIKFLSGQTISGTLTVSGNVQGATFNGLAINTTGVNNLANQIVRTQANGYVNFGWINSVSGNHTGSITRITASNDAYLRYVTPAQFRTGVTDGFYAPVSTVSGVTSVATGNGLTGGTITSTGTLTMSGDYTGIFTVHEGRVWDPTTQGTAKGSIHIDPDEGTDHAGGAITFGASDASSGSNAQAGIYIRSDGSYGTKMYLATTDSYGTGSKTALNIDHSGNVNITRGFLQISNGNLTLAGTGRIQGVDTVSASTDAANKAYVDAHPGSGGTVTSVATGSGLTGGTITTTGTLSLDRPNSQLGAVLATYGTTAGASGRVRCTAPFNTNSSKMFSIEVTLYTNYTQHNYVVSAYMYSTTNQWYSPKAIYTTTGTATPDIIVGRDGNGKAYISIANSAYTGVLVHNMTRGYTTSLANTYEPWTITIDAGTENSTGVATSQVWTSGNHTPGNYLPVANPNFTGTLQGPVLSGDVTASGDGQSNYPFRLGADYSAYMMAAAGNTWGLFWAGNSGARYGTNGNGGPGNIWSNSTNPNEFCFVGSDTTRWSVAGGTGDTWQQGNIYLSGTFIRANNNLNIQVYGQGTPVSAITIDNVGSTTFSGYTYFPNYLFHAGDTNTRIEFTTGTVTLRGDTSILLDGPVTANSTMTVASTLTTNGQITANSTIYLKDRITLPASGLSSVSGRPGYAIYQEGGAWTHPYPDLCIAMHTGIKFGANASYNGMRFYDDYTMATQVMSINNVSDGLGAGNVYINDKLQVGTDVRAPIYYDVNDTAYYLNAASTSNLNTLTLAGSLTVQSGSGTINGKATQLFEHGYGSDSGTFYQDSGSFAGYSGWANYWIGNHGNGATYYNTVDIRPFWGPPKYSRLEGGTFRGPYNYVTNENDQTIGVYLQSTTSLRAPIFYDYNNTAFYLDPSTTGTSVNVAGDVVAYASSDIRFKNNITPITNALDKLSKIGGYTFEWNEISHKETGKKDIGVVAQEVEEILPEIVQTRSNGYKAVDYQKLTALLIESVKEQQVIINDLKSRIETLENN